MPRFVPGASVALALLLMTAAPAQAREVRVGIYSNPPKLEVAENGQPGGILGEVLVAMAREEGWQLRVVPCEWDGCVEALSRGELDLLPDMAHTDERARQFDLHARPALRSWSQLYTRPGLRLESIPDLDGKRVAVLEGSVQQDYLATLAEGFGLQVQWLPVPTLEDALEATASGRADAMATNHFFGGCYAGERGLGETGIVFQPSRLYYATTAGRNADLLAAIDRHLAQWQQDPASPYFDALRRWGAAEVPARLPAWLPWAAGLAALLLVLGAVGMGLLRREVSRKTRSLQASERRLADILDSVDAHIYIKDAGLKYRYVNRRTAQLFGLPAGEIEGKGDEAFFDPDTVVHLKANDLRVVRDGERLATEEVNRAREDGSIERAYFSVKIPLRDAEGRINALCGISTEITEQLHLRREIERLADFDPLTQLPNRKHFIERLRRALQEAKAEGAQGGLLLLNLDRFKELNDSRGHQAGDEWLRQVAQRLRPVLGEGQLLARVGADEFGVLVPGLPLAPQEAHRQLAQLAQRLLDTVGTPGDLAGARYHGSACAGGLVFPAQAASAQDALRNADLALAEAKAAGAGRFQHFVTEMHEALAARASLETDLREALERDEFLLHYQPQVDGAGRLVGLEALVRWQHPRRGLVPPGSFIPLAEASGLIMPLGDWVLRQAIAELAVLAARPATAGLRIAVNVSARQLHQPDFVDKVLSAMKKAGLAPDRLELELTESELVEDIGQAVEKLGALRAGGIRIALDDFGTGYSALNYVKQLPLDVLKIDTSFVRDLLVDPSDLAIVRTIISLGQSLGLVVLAEGVEETAQRDLLAELGCHQFQGYLFSRPRPLAELGDWLG